MNDDVLKVTCKAEEKPHLVYGELAMWSEYYVLNYLKSQVTFEQSKAVKERTLHGQIELILS